MRRWKTLLAVIGLLVAACGGNEQNNSASSTPSKTTTTTPAQPPVAQAALPNLLLSPAEVDVVLGLTGPSSIAKTDKLHDDSDLRQPSPTGWKFPDECIYAFGPLAASVYAGSGNTAASGDDDLVSAPTGSNDLASEVMQGVASFPSANEANAFFTASSQRWQACANRDVNPPGTDNLVSNFAVGPISNANGTLSTTVNIKTPGFPDGPPLTMSCQRALTVRNNVAIDVKGCRTNPGDVAVNAVNQIAGKVDSANTNVLAGSMSKGYGLNNCQPAAAAKLTGPVLAELDCGQSPDPGGPASAIYRLLPNADALASDFKNMIQDLTLTACGADNGQTPATWGWHQGQGAGQAACGTQKDAATLAWTTDGKNVVSSIRSSNTDVNSLYQWWLANG